MMGACTFMQVATGDSAASAFRSAVLAATAESGSGGYSGTIAEKMSLTIIECPDGEDPEDFANRLMDEDDPRISDKWGPAGCIELGNNRYLFFGWASE